MLPVFVLHLGGERDKLFKVSNLKNMLIQELICSETISHTITMSNSGLCLSESIVNSWR